MADGVQEQIDAIGQAKVLIVLAPAAAADIEASQLDDNFVTPSGPQQAQFASLMMSAARQSGRRPPPTGERTLPRLRIFRRLGLAIGTIDHSGAAALDADRRVQNFALIPELSLIRPVAVGPAPAPSDITWGIKRLRVPELWDAGYNGDGVIVGHLDTGVDGTHPALAAAIGAFAEFDMAGNQVPRASAHDTAEHGTHTAGTIAGRPGAKGAIGVAPGAKLASALVIEGGQVIERVLGGLEWALSQNVRIISISLGLRGYTPAFQAIVDGVLRANVLPVFAVGNEGANTSRSPGNYDDVLSVGAMDQNDAVPYWSGSQWFSRALNPLVPDVVAPGAGVLSAKPGGGYQTMDGSSMATPHIAGLAALLSQAKPNASAKDLENAIVNSCVRPGSMTEDRANHGVPDAVAAFTALTGHSPQTAHTAGAVAGTGITGQLRRLFAPARIRKAGKKGQPKKAAARRTAKQAPARTPGGAKKGAQGGAKRGGQAGKRPAAAKRRSVRRPTGKR